MKSLPRWWMPELAVVIGIPAASVLGGILTLALATGDLSDDSGHTGAGGNSQMQTADVAPDLAAARVGLSAQVQLDRASGEVRVQLPPRVSAQEWIEVTFVHSLRAGDDLRARLQPRDGLWIAKLAPDADTRWRVVLAGSDPRRPDQRWRLVGTLPRDGAALSLKSAVAPP
jgi:hypothetical protein